MANFKRLCSFLPSSLMLITLCLPLQVQASPDGHSQGSRSGGSRSIHHDKDDQHSGRSGRSANQRHNSHTDDD
jgi:hypothetical protein